MDAPTRPLRLWERVYWRLLVVVGGVGFAYETWVMGNRRLWKGEIGGVVAGSGGGGEREVNGLYGGNHAFGSQRLLTDEEVRRERALRVE